MGGWQGWGEGRPGRSDAPLSAYFFSFATQNLRSFCIFCCCWVCVMGLLLCVCVRVCVFACVCVCVFEELCDMCILVFLI